MANPFHGVDFHGVMFAVECERGAADFTNLVSSYLSLFWIIGV